MLTVAADRLLQLADLGQCGVLPAGAQKIAETVESNTSVSVLVEERESLFVVGRSLVFKCVRCHCLEFAEFRLVCAQSQVGFHVREDTGADRDRILVVSVDTEKIGGCNRGRGGAVSGS